MIYKINNKNNIIISEFILRTVKQVSGQKN